MFRLLESSGAMMIGCWTKIFGVSVVGGGVAGRVVGVEVGVGLIVDSLREVEVEGEVLVQRMVDIGMDKLIASRSPKQKSLQSIEHGHMTDLRK